MDDPRAAEGVEHLQSAARELLKAARSFLDVVEDVVEDPERLTGAAAGLVDVVRSGLGRPDAPWVDAAWDRADDAEGSGADTFDAAAGIDPDPSDEQTAPSPASRRRSTAAGSSRVRRISVD